MWTDRIAYYETQYAADEILVYLRKSRSDDPSLSVEQVLEKHESILREWAERNLETPIPEENIYREVVSGETIDGRPKMQEVLKRMESPKIKAILVVEVQRLSRGDLEDCGRLMKLLRYTHTRIITPVKTYDLEDEYDRDAFERELKRGNDYLEYTKKILKRGILLSVQEGNYLGTYPPYGYNKITITIGKKKCPTLEINEDEAKVVRMIFNWYGNEDVSTRHIAERLNNMGIRTRNGKLWARSTIRAILFNEHYIGKVRFNYRMMDRTVIDQEVVTCIKLNSEYDLYEGKHEGIIDEELFYKVKNKPNRRPKTKIKTPLQSPLASILYCSCGSVMVYHKQSKKFICDNQIRCGNGSIDYTEIIPEICQYLKHSIDDYATLMKNSDGDLIKQHEEHIEFLKKKLDETMKKEISIWEKYSEEGMPKSVFENLKRKCEADKKDLESALENAYNNIPVRVDYEQKIVQVHKCIDALMDDSISAEAKNKLLRTVIDRIDCSRPLSVRMSKEEAREKGISLKNGWYTRDYKLDIRLLV